MMGASIQAPLAALTAMIELTYSPQIVMPGMLAVVIAGLTASELFGKESIFSAVLKAAGMDYNADPVTQALGRIGVASVMQRNYARTGAQLSRRMPGICWRKSRSGFWCTGSMSRLR